VTRVMKLPFKLSSLALAFAVFALVEKQIISLDIATSLIIFLCAWVIAHVYDAGYWYNRNLVIIANIERQFLKPSDLRDIHYYFGRHRKTGALITHLEIQMYLAIGVALLVLATHFFTDVLPVLQKTKPGTNLTYLPWAATVIGLAFWGWSKRKFATRYDTFLANSPGKEIDDSAHITAPDAIAVELGQFTNRLAVRQIVCNLFDTLGHRWIPPAANLWLRAQAARRTFLLTLCRGNDGRRSTARDRLAVGGQDFLWWSGQASRAGAGSIASFPCSTFVTLPVASMTKVTRSA